ncbi:hypothetical protein L6452_11463 [Arctium lappa]|uniref:Uncharacterized protein n=1 Tax=Arctium lappa TaxID=4217 RepID=A0ACB9DPD2_ARCLA|nr:hypothetical protein L6452_11463 [Arctium lappa]
MDVINLQPTHHLSTTTCLLLCLPTKHISLQFIHPTFLLYKPQPSATLNSIIISSPNSHPHTYIYIH